MSEAPKVSGNESYVAGFRAGWAAALAGQQGEGRTDEPERISDLIAQTSDDEALRVFAEAMQDAERGGEADDVTLPYHIAYKIAALAFDHPSRYEPAGAPSRLHRWLAQVLLGFRWERR